ncbi:MAG TPA: rhodanese-like domain-containing protein [Planctomycetota bacterium]|nr:rhodanese-like domain-containing protein [Planctomycetota bacterium]
MSDNPQPYRSLPPKAAAELLRTQDALLFDVRTPPEFESHHIQGAVLLPIQELQTRHPEIPRDSKRPILIVCEHGIRSVHACRALSEAGWTNLINVSGGMAAWMEEGLPFNAKGVA